MTPRTIRIAALALGIYAFSAVPALAAPDHTAVLGGDKTKFEWDGAAQVSAGVPLGVREGIPCKTPVLRPCEEVLFEITEAGKLTVKVDGGPGGPPEDDVDIYLYKSDKAGAPSGDPIASGVAAGPDTISVKVTTGFYLAQVDYYRAKASAYKGVATFVSSAPPAAAIPPTIAAPTPPATTAPAPAARPAKPRSSKAKAKAALKRCQKKAKKIKNAKKRKAALKRCAKKAKRGAKS